MRILARAEASGCLRCGTKTGVQLENLYFDLGRAVRAVCRVCGWMHDVVVEPHNPHEREFERPSEPLKFGPRGERMVCDVEGCGKTYAVTAQTKYPFCQSHAKKYGHGLRKGRSILAVVRGDDGVWRENPDYEAYVSKFRGGGLRGART